jgi:hypothetical protein
MPYIWYREGSDVWTAWSLSEGTLDVGGDTPKEYSPEESCDRRNSGSAEVPSNGGAVVFRVDDDRLAETWVLVWGREREVRLNGLRLSTGIRVLADRDEIKIDSFEPVFFSGESRPRVELFPGAESEVICPRCKRTIEKNSSMVRCDIPRRWTRTFGGRLSMYGDEG